MKWLAPGPEWILGESFLDALARFTARMIVGGLLVAVLGGLVSAMLGCATLDTIETPCADTTCAHIDPGDPAMDRCLIVCQFRRNR
jgi:hypothetical protein